MKKTTLAIFIVVNVLTLLHLLVPKYYAQEGTRYMLIYTGAHGLHYYCLEASPYAIERPMLWDSEHGAIEVEDYQLIAQVLEVESCNLDNVYMADNGDLFTWRFSSHNTDGHESHRHIDRGVFWITWLRDLYR